MCVSKSDIVLMKKLFYILGFIMLSGTAFAQQNPKFNRALADSLGADQYGMKMYVLVILRTGAATPDKDAMSKAFAGHMNNIEKLAAAGKLVVAGPIGKNDKNYRGIFILNATMEEAPALLDTDPAISGKYLEPELIPWYGSAALAKYLPFHDQVYEKEF